MGDILGLNTGNLSIPKVDFTGFFSNTWVYILVIALIGIISIAIIALILFKKTYNRKVVLFENISGRGFQPVLKTSARVIKVGTGGMEVLKTLAGGFFLDSNAKKMGNKTYWFAKGQDGYYYNFLMGDLDAKLGMLDIEPVDRDVRMFHVGIDKLRAETYNKKGWFDEHGNQVMTIVFLVVALAGLWLLFGRLGDAMKMAQATAQTNKEVATLLRDILQSTSNIKSQGGIGGLIPAVT